LPLARLAPRRAGTNSTDNALNSIVKNIASFYDANYRLADSNIVLRSTDKRRLGDRANRRCRFCGKEKPEVTFKQETHALPEAIGNKSLITYYESDACNQKFGREIDNEFGKWSKPLRTFYQIGGKDGVPTLKREGPGGWRIELKQDGFVFQEHVDRPMVQIGCGKGAAVRGGIHRQPCADRRFQGVCKDGALLIA